MKQKKIEKSGDNMKNIKRFEPTTPLEWGEERVMIHKNGEFVRCIQYTDMSGSAMMDVTFALKRQYPKEQGYTVDW